MWYPVKIWAKNVFSFSEIEHSFARGVTTTIVGVNRDDSSQGGNGSGKSALIEVLAIATTGSPLRKVNIDEVISDSADRAVVGVIYRQTDSTKELKIERKFSRKDSSTANAEVYGSLGLIASSDTGIDACNEFIFSHLGVSKDEIFSNFILSKYKYKNFLSVSDNEKKAIINRFSNGVLVDQAIESLLVDKTECLKNQRDIEIKFHESKAKCEAISSQIEENESLREDKIQKNQEQIQSKKEELSIQRSLKRELSLKLKDHSLKIAEAKN
ncbi:MAG: AAA family ATPase, partial [Clostridia bacterium]